MRLVRIDSPRRIGELGTTPCHYKRIAEFKCSILQSRARIPDGGLPGAATEAAGGEDVLRVEGGFEGVCEGEVEAGRDSDAEALFEDRGAQNAKLGRERGVVLV